MFYMFLCSHIDSAFYDGMCGYDLPTSFWL